jgi:hypothetical protein
MATIVRSASFSLLVLTVLLARPSAGQVPLTPRDAAALQQWTLNLEDYSVLREQAARVAPPPRLPASATELLRAEATFAAEIRARRPAAQVGDLFTFDVRRTFRKLIARAITEHQIVLADLLADLVSDIVASSEGPVVNQRLPWQLGAAIPPCLLAALPPLPKELQYRLVGRDLVLIDLDANLVIDILPEALPRPASDTSSPPMKGRNRP